MEKGKPGTLAELAIRDGGKTTLIRQEDIEWVEAAGDYMCVHALGETHILRKTMKKLEVELEADFLQRIHRSTIVSARSSKCVLTSTVSTSSSWNRAIP